MYGWNREYIINNLSMKDIEIFYVEGMQSDLLRRGFKVNRTEETKSIEELKEWYDYTPEEIEAEKRYKESLRK
jgi:hypothetical protein